MVIPGMGRRISGEDRNNSLNTSTVEQEGKIDSSPKKNPTNQLYIQNPFDPSTAFTRKLNSSLKG